MEAHDEMDLLRSDLRITKVAEVRLGRVANKTLSRRSSSSSSSVNSTT